jgi:centrosomal protein POC5
MAAHVDASSASHNAMDNKSQMDIVQNDDIALIGLAQDLDEQTANLRISVLNTVKNMRGRITSQATAMIDGERATSRDRERSLLTQIDQLQRLLTQRTADLDQERALTERLIQRHQTQAKRRRQQELAREAFQAWRTETVEKKRREKMCQHLLSVRRDKAARQLFNTWRVGALRAKQAEKVEKLEGECRRAKAKQAMEHQSSEGALKLEMLAMRDQLSKEEERRAILEERLKAAFMRGVCALNMEAMTVLRNTPADGDVSMASMLQAMNLTQSVDSQAAEAPSTERLMRQQEALQAQIMQFQQPDDTAVMERPAAALQLPLAQQHVVSAAPAYHRPASAAGRPAAAAPHPAAAAPGVHVTLNPHHPGSSVPQPLPKSRYGRK